MRRAAALAIVPLLAVVALAGCSSSSSTPGASASASSTADTYKSVTVTGAFGKTPTVTIPKVAPSGPLYTKTLIEGTGAKLTSTEGMIGNVVGYDWSGKTSKLVGSNYSPGLFIDGQVLTSLENALVGQKLGSRVLAVIPPSDGLGTSGTQEGIAATDTLVFVVDMTSTFNLTSVPGTPTSDGGGTLPTVTEPKAGSTSGPTMTINTKAAPPKTLEDKTLIKGTGAVVKKGDDIAVQYNGYIWRTGKSFQSSWTDGQGVYSTEIGVGATIPGWDDDLVGQTVGSQVLLSIPPADGYGTSGNSQAGIKGTDTLEFVVDILAAS
jgi:FKBP-type peptidyl-prolyl cis-trans isomerase